MSCLHLHLPVIHLKWLWKNKIFCHSFLQLFQHLCAQETKSWVVWFVFCFCFLHLITCMLKTRRDRRLNIPWKENVYVPCWILLFFGFLLSSGYSTADVNPCKRRCCVGQFRSIFLVGAVTMMWPFEVLMCFKTISKPIF